MPTGTRRSPTSSTKPKRSRAPRTARVPIRPSPFWPHPPSPKQGAFLALPHLEALYGGAAGGGKSDALLMAALQYVDVADYSALLLRKTYPELAQPGGLIDRAHEWLQGKGPRWKETEHTWTFPSGAKLTFGYLQRATDRYRYQGAEFDFVGFDELTHFEEAEYRYLFSRLRRREGSLVPTRMRAATNPGGRGHEWVKRRFIAKEPHPDDPTETLEKRAARIFIPARLRDNPGVDIESYRRSLDELDPQTQAQLLDGDWDAREPGDWFFADGEIDGAVSLGRELDELRLAKKLEPEGGELALGLDWGESTHAVVIWPLEAGGVYVTAELAIANEEPGAATKRMLRMAEAHPFPLEEARYDAAGVQSMRTFVAVARAIPRYRRLRSRSVPFSKWKREVAGYLRLLFRRAGNGQKTRVMAISPSCPVLIAQLRKLERDPEGAGWLKDEDQHGPDALVAGAQRIARVHRTTREDRERVRS